jgi:hypothetical protein
VNIRNNTFLSPEHAVAVDMGEMFDSLTQTILQELFVNKKRTEEETEMNQLLNVGRLHMGFQCGEERIDYYGVLPYVRERARQRFLSMVVPSETMANWVQELLQGNDIVDSVPVEDRMVFCFSVLPFLLQDCMNDTKVWCFVNLLVALSCFFNYDGDYDGAEEYQRTIQLVLSLMESQWGPQFENLHFHPLVHLLSSYKQLGPLAGVSTLHSRHVQANLVGDCLGGNNPLVTIMRRVSTRKAASLVAFDSIYKSVDQGTEFVVAVPSRPLNALLSDIATLEKRVVMNWMADRVQLKNDLMPHLSFTDVELCDGVAAYVNNRFVLSDRGFVESSETNYGTNDKKSRFKKNDLMWRTRNEDLWLFYTRCGFRSQTFFHFSNLQILESLVVNGTLYESLELLPSQLTMTDFGRKTFAVTYSVCRKLHLFVIYRYLTLYHGVANELYVQALAYEIPIRCVLPLIDSPYCFFVSLEEVNMIRPQFTLLSLHRLHIHDLWFTDNGESELYGGVLTPVIRQWNDFSEECVRTDVQMQPRVISMIQKGKRDRGVWCVCLREWMVMRGW